MRIAVIGLGETGKPLFKILNAYYGDVVGIDIGTKYEGVIDVLNVCIPYSENFVNIVSEYGARYRAGLVINHATVPVGTTAQIPNAVHSPILGDHTNMEDSIMRFVKWIGGERAGAADIIMAPAGIPCRTVPTSEETELLKLMCLAKYGVSISFAQYQKDVFDKYGFDYSHVIEWDMVYTLNVDGSKKRPVLTPPGKKIGGHCVVPGVRNLFIDHPNPMLAEVLKYA